MRTFRSHEVSTKRKNVSAAVFAIFMSHGGSSFEAGFHKGGDWESRSADSFKLIYELSDKLTAVHVLQQMPASCST